MSLCGQPTFLPSTTSLFLLPLPVKSLALYSSSELPSFRKMGCWLIYESLNKVSKIFNIYPVEFFLTLVP